MRQARDPVASVKNWLLGPAGATADEVKEVEQSVRKEIDAAVEQAKKDLPPPASELSTPDRSPLAPMAPSAMAPKPPAVRASMSRRDMGSEAYRPQEWQSFMAGRGRPWRRSSRGQVW